MRGIVSTIVFITLLPCAAAVVSNCEKVGAANGVSAPPVRQFSASTGKAGKVLPAGLCIFSSSDAALIGPRDFYAELRRIYTNEPSGNVANSATVITGLYGALGVHQLPEDKAPRPAVLLSQLAAIKLHRGPSRSASVCNPGSVGARCRKVEDLWKGGRLCGVLVVAGGSGTPAAAENALAPLLDKTYGTFISGRGSTVGRGERVVVLCEEPTAAPRLEAFLCAAASARWGAARTGPHTLPKTDAAGNIMNCMSPIAGPALTQVRRFQGPTEQEKKAQAERVFNDAYVAYFNDLFFVSTLARQPFPVKCDDVTNRETCGYAETFRMAMHMEAAKKLGQTMERALDEYELRLYIQKKNYKKLIDMSRGNGGDKPSLASDLKKYEPLQTTFLPRRETVIAAMLADMASPTRDSYLRAKPDANLAQSMLLIHNIMIQSNAEPALVHLSATAEVWQLLYAAHFGPGGCPNSERDVQRAYENAGMHLTWFRVACSTDDGQTSRLLVDFVRKRAVVWVAGVHDAKDIWPLIKMAAGKLASSTRFIHAERLLARARADFPDYIITVGGHSLGGACAIKLAELYGLDADVFNPAPLPSSSDKSIFKVIKSAAVSMSLRPAKLIRTAFSFFKGNPRVMADLAKVAANIKVANFESSGTVTIHAILGDAFCGGYFGPGVTGYKKVLYPPLFRDPFNNHQFGLMVILSQQPLEPSASAPTIIGQKYPDANALDSAYSALESVRPGLPGSPAYDGMLQALFAALPSHTVAGETSSFAADYGERLAALTKTQKDDNQERDLILYQSFGALKEFRQRQQLQRQKPPPPPPPQAQNS